MKKLHRHLNDAPRAGSALPAAIVGLTLALAAVICTTAAATSWSARSISSQNLFDVSFPVAARGWAVGNTGTILSSSNSGQTWAAQVSGTASELHAVDFIDADIGWAVGADDTVLYTTNGGASWTRTTSGAGANLADVDFVDANNGSAVGALLLANVIVHTTDGGRTWTQQVAPAGIGLVGVSFADEQRGFAVGFTGAAYRTDDGGNTWIEMVVNPSSDNYYAAVRINSAEGLIGGFSGNIYRTQDGGVTWSVVGSVGKAVRRLAVAGSSAFAVGDQGLVARSEDGGLSWNLESSGTLHDLKGVSESGATGAFGVGNGGTLVQFTATPAVPLPLTVGPLAESCVGLRILWKHDAAGALVAATSGDLDGDGSPEIVASGPSGLRVLRPFLSTEQSTLWTLPFHARFQDVRVAELDGDSATKEIVAATAASGISRSGVLALNGATGQVLWSRRTPGGSRAVRTADFDRDGFDDVVAVGDGRTLSWLSGRDGTDLYPTRAFGQNATDLEIANLNGDEVPDVVVAVGDGKVVALNGATGAALWTYQSQAGNPGSFGGLRAITLGDLTGDGVADAVAVGEGTPVSTIPGNGNCGSITVGSVKGALIVALDGATGSRLWDYAEPGSETFYAVSLGEFNRDGTPDVVGHASGIDKGHLVALDGRGKTAQGVRTGDAQTLWGFSTTREDEAYHFAASSEAIAVGDGNADATRDAYVALSDGRIVAVSGTVPAGVPGGCAPSATELWTVSQGRFSRHVSFVQIASQSLLLAVSEDLLTLRSSATGALAWPYDNGGEPTLAVGDLNGDGGLDLGVGTFGGRIYGLEGDGTPLSLNDNFLPRDVVGVVAAPVLGATSRELVGVSSDGTIRAVNPGTGQQIWQTQLGVTGTSITSGSGLIVVGGSDGRVVAFASADGVQMWQSVGSARIKAITFDSGTNRFVAGDSNGDGRMLDVAGQTQASFATGTASVGGVNAIALADVDGNGTTEFAVAAGRAFVVVRQNGSQIWRYDVPSVGLVTAPQIAAIDLDGDGAQEIVGAATDSKAYAFAGRTGSLLWSIDNELPGGIAGMDVDGDGKEEALIGAESFGFPLGNGTLKAVRANGTLLASCVLSKSAHAISVGDFDSDGSPEAAMATLEGDVYLFEGLPSGVQPLSVVSRKDHGTAGSFDINLPLTGAGGIECRSGGAGGNHQIIVSFAVPVTFGSASVSSGSGAVAETSTSSDGKQLTLNLTSVTNAQTTVVKLSAVNDGTKSSDVAIPMRVLTGDSNADGTVNSGDAQQTRNRSGRLTDANNFRSDVNTDGTINSGDAFVVRSKSGSTITPELHSNPLSGGFR